MTCWFFVSYARDDDKENLIRKFSKSLKDAVSSKIHDQSPPVAYFDQENLQPGDHWPDEIANALCICNTFLPIMTAPYFTREYCGKEWTIFEDRLRELGSSSPPPLIIPILWDKPVGRSLPKYATDLQVTLDLRAVSEAEQIAIEDYREYGLVSVAKRMGIAYRDVYNKIVDRLAIRIIEVAEAHPLQPLARAALRSFETVSNRFTAIEQVQPAPAAASGRANFAIVAASEVDWKPYAPKEPERIGLIAQAVATEKRLIANWLPVGPGLVRLLEQAEADHSVAVMIVDPWVVQHPRYRAVLQQFDKVQLRNCVVLIPWNKSDATMEAARDNLLADLRYVLSRNFEGRKEIYFRPKIENHASLRAELSCALTVLESMLAQHRQPARTTGKSDHNQPPQLQA